MENSMSFLPFSSSSSSFAEEFRGRPAVVDGGGFFCYVTLIALLFILLWHFLFSSSSSSSRKSLLLNSAACRASAASVSVPECTDSGKGIPELVTDEDLKGLIQNLDENAESDETWENVIDKRKNLLSYRAKCCKPKDAGPVKYLSTTVFENCSPEVLRDFYMDNDYRKRWDSTVVEHQQLQVDVTSGIEIGQTIKKFPLLTPREYILAWKLWEGKDNSFYCFIKECEHHLAPRQKKFVRVGYFRSGWQIRKVPGRNACEIKMFHQEDAGLNVEMAKLVFSKGIWGYVCKMDNALRKYPATRHLHTDDAVSAVSLIRKVPPEVETGGSVSSPATGGLIASGELFTPKAKEKNFFTRPSTKLLAQGLILFGGAVCLSRGHSALGAKVAMPYFCSKLSKRNASSSQGRQNSGT